LPAISNLLLQRKNNSNGKASTLLLDFSETEGIVLELIDGSIKQNSESTKSKSVKNKTKPTKTKEKQQKKSDEID